jgi:hypothetical protein
MSQSDVGGLELPLTMGGVVMSQMPDGRPQEVKIASGEVKVKVSTTSVETKHLAVRSVPSVFSRPPPAPIVATIKAFGTPPLPLGAPAAASASGSEPDSATSTSTTKSSKGMRRRQYEMKTAINSKAAIVKRNKFDWALPELWTITGIMALIVYLNFFWWAADMLPAPISWWTRTAFVVIGIPWITTIPPLMNTSVQLEKNKLKTIDGKQVSLPDQGAGTPEDAARLIVEAAEKSVRGRWRTKLLRVMIINLTGVPLEATKKTTLASKNVARGEDSTEDSTSAESDQRVSYTPQQRSHAMFTSGFWFLCLASFFGGITNGHLSMGLVIGCRAMTAVLCLDDEYGKHRSVVAGVNVATAILVWTGFWFSAITPALGLLLGLGLIALWRTLPFAFTFFHEIVLLELIKTTLLQVDGVSDWVLSINGQNAGMLFPGTFWMILWVNLTLYSGCICLGRKPGILGQDALKALDNVRVRTVRCMIYAFPFFSVYTQHWILCLCVFFGTFLMSLIPFYTVEMADYVQNLVNKLKRGSATEIVPMMEEEVKKVMSMVKVTNQV